MKTTFICPLCPWVFPMPGHFVSVAYMYNYQYGYQIDPFENGSKQLWLGTNSEAQGGLEDYQLKEYTGELKTHVSCLKWIASL